MGVLDTGGATLQIGFGNTKSRWATINNAANGRAMAFTE